MTKQEKPTQIHDILPYVGSYIADLASAYDEGPDWFPRPEQWPIVFDLACDFGEWPEGTTEDEVRALCKAYVGYKDPQPVAPDPNFWADMEARFPTIF